MTKTCSWILPLALLGCGDAETPTGWDPVAEPSSGAGAYSPDQEAAVDGLLAAVPDPTVWVSDELLANSPPAGGSSFSLDATDTLYFYAYFPVLPIGAHVAVLDLDGPDGYLYDTLYAPFTVGSNRGSSGVPTHATSGTELTEMGWRVVLELPVAGSRIDLDALTGAWNAHLLLDVVAGPAMFDASFDLY